MKHDTARALWALLAALLLASPAWADGGGLGGEKFNFNIIYDDSEDGADDDGASSGANDGPTVESLDTERFKDFLWRGASGSHGRFSITTKLESEINFDLAFEEFGAADQNLSGDAVFTSRSRLNFDTSFTGEDSLRVRLSARDTNGFAKQGKAPTVRSVNPVTFGHTEDTYGFSSEPKYTFNVGASWQLRADYDTNNFSDGYITGRRIPSAFDPAAIADRFFGSDSVRYDTPTFAGFTTSSAWDEGSGREVPVTPSAASNGQNGTTDPPETGFQINGAIGALIFHPEAPEILKNVELIPSELLLPEFQKYKFDRALNILLKGFYGNDGRGSEGESDRVEQPLSPRRVRFGVRLRF